MTLFKAIDHVVKIRRQSYSEVESLPFYQFNYILDAIKEEAEKEKEEQEQQKTEQSTQASKYKNQTFKPVDTGKIMRDSQAAMKNFKPK